MSGVKAPGWEKQKKKVLASIAAKIVQNMDAAAKYAADEANSRAPSYLKGAVEYKVTAEGEVVEGIVYVGKKNTWVGTLANWAEFGTRPHTVDITNKRRAWIKSLAGDDSYFGKEIEHPGTPAQPFVRPAVYGNKDRIRKILAGE